MEKYSKELKASVTYEICEQGKSTSKVAEKYNVPLKTVENWITRYNKNNEVYQVYHVSDAEKIKILEEKLIRLQRDNDILKKTLKLLAKKE